GAGPRIRAALAKYHLFARERRGDAGPRGMFLRRGWLRKIDYGRGAGPARASGAGGGYCGAGRERRRISCGPRLSARLLVAGKRDYAAGPRGCPAAVDAGMGKTLPRTRRAEGEIFASEIAVGHFVSVRAARQRAGRA